MYKKKSAWLVAIFILFCTIFIISDGYSNTASAKSMTYCIKATPEISEAAYKYLDEIYIEKFPDFGLAFPYGSEGDKSVLKSAADKITRGAKNDREKVNKIIKWVDSNINYRSMTSSEGYLYAIDVYYNKKGNCVGISQLILNFCRLSGIRAVMCCGARGDMEKNITLESKVPDHAWTMIHIDGKWYLYDPLFNVYGSSDKKFIDKWYFFDMIEGISPYVEKYAKYMWTGSTFFYVNGRFMSYINGKPGLEHYNGGSYTPGYSVNNCMPFFATPKNTYDGYEYVENPQREDSMINDECYSNGWIKYGNSIYYTYPNSIKSGARIIDHNGQCLYFSYMSSAVVLPGKSKDYTLTDGYLTLYKGQKISVTVPGLKEELDKGAKLVWECEDPNIAKVDKNGVITAVSEGFVWLAATVVYEDGGYNSLALFQIYILPEKRTVTYPSLCEHQYKTSLTAATLSKNGSSVKKCKICGFVEKTTKIYYPKTIKLSADTYTYNGKIRKPSVTVKDSKGKALKNGTDYTLKYSKGRKAIGTYTVTVTFKGNYSGTKKLTFKIVPAKPALTKLTSGTNKLTAAWKAVTGATGYEVAYSTSKSFAKKTTKKVKVKKARKITINKLKKSKKYYVKVRAYKEVNRKKIFGAYSSVKYVKVK